LGLGLSDNITDASTLNQNRFHLSKSDTRQHIFEEIVFQAIKKTDLRKQKYMGNV